MLCRDDHTAVFLMARIGSGDDKLMSLDGFLEEFFTGGVELREYIIHEDNWCAIAEIALEIELEQLEGEHDSAHLAARGDFDSGLIVQVDREIFAVRSGARMSSGDFVVTRTLEAIEEGLFVVLECDARLVFDAKWRFGAS